MDQDGRIDATMVSLNFGLGGEVERAVVTRPGSREPPTQGIGPVPAEEVGGGAQEGCGPAAASSLPLSCASMRQMLLPTLSRPSLSQAD